MSQIKYVKKNVLTQKFARTTLICHICNDRGGFGSGYAGAVRRIWPHVANEYRNWHQSTDTSLIVLHRDSTLFNPALERLENVSSDFCLGEIQAVEVSKDSDVYSVQMLGQSIPGGRQIRIGDRSIYLRPFRPDSLRECLLNVASLAKELNADVVGPAFGSGLAGGDWHKEIVPIINDCLCSFGISPTIYLYGDSENLADEN